MTQPPPHPARRISTTCVRPKKTQARVSDGYEPGTPRPAETTGVDWTGKTWVSRSSGSGKSGRQPRSWRVHTLAHRCHQTGEASPKRAAGSRCVIPISLRTNLGKTPESSGVTTHSALSGQEPVVPRYPEPGSPIPHPRGTHPPFHTLFNSRLRAAGSILTAIFRKLTQTPAHPFHPSSRPYFIPDDSALPSYR